MTTKFHTITTIKQLFDQLPVKVRESFLKGISKEPIPETKSAQSRMLVRLAYNEINADKMFRQLWELVRDHGGTLKAMR